MKMEGLSEREYASALEELERAYASTETAKEYLVEILRILGERGLLPGEMSCSIESRRAV